MPPSLRLGIARPLDGRAETAPLDVPASHLVTHGVVVGMTGSGKTGLVTVMVEEALRAQVPVLVIDVKRDLPNLLLAFPSFAAEHFRPWVDEVPDSVTAGSASPVDAVATLAARLAEERRRGLEAFGVAEADVAAFAAFTQVRVITPGADAGEMLRVLSSLERRSSRWDSDVEGARARRCPPPSRSSSACSGGTRIQRAAASTCCSPYWPSVASSPVTAPTSPRSSPTWSTRPSRPSARSTSTPS